jgi:hypothetical protein
LSEVGVVAVSLRAVNVEDASPLVEVHDDQFVGELSECADVAPGDVVAVFEDEPGQCGFRADGDVSVEDSVGSVVVERGLGVPGRDGTTVGDGAHLGLPARVC